MSGSPAGGAAAQQQVDWAALRSYIEQKEAYERQNQHPAPLTENELSAIAVLLRPAVQPTPDVGDKNWVSMLNHFLQVRRQSVTFKDDARQEPRLGKAPDLRWACFVIFDSTGDRFPQVGHGISADAPGLLSPDFTKKQDAKQYAAKFACEWLIANGHMLDSGEIPKFARPFVSAAAAAAAPIAAPTASAAASAATVFIPAKRSPPRTPPIEIKHEAIGTSGSGRGDNSSGGSGSKESNSSQKAPKTEANSTPNSTPNSKPPAAAAAAAAARHLPTSSWSLLSASDPASESSSSTGSPVPNGAAVTSPPPSSPPPRSNTDGNGGGGGGVDRVPATTRVADLCKRLKYPIPRYELQVDGTLPGQDFWTGRPDFDNDPRIPENLGAVTRVFTKKAAKERMAEAVLDWLVAQLEERERKSKAVLWQ